MALEDAMSSPIDDIAQEAKNCLKINCKPAAEDGAS